MSLAKRVAIIASCAVDPFHTIVVLGLSRWQYEPGSSKASPIELNLSSEFTATIDMNGGNRKMESNDSEFKKVLDITAGCMMVILL